MKKMYMLDTMLSKVTCDECGWYLDKRQAGYWLYDCTNPKCGKTYFVNELTGEREEVIDTNNANINVEEVLI